MANDEPEDRMEALGERLLEHCVNEADRDAFVKGWDACLDMVLERIEDRIGAPRLCEELEEERKASDG